MHVIALNVKGTMDEALEALVQHNMTFKFGRSFDAGTIRDGILLSQFLVDGRYIDDVEDWFRHRGATPHPVGTLLNYWWYTNSSAVESAVRDFNIAPLKGTDVAEALLLTLAQAQEKCHSPGAVTSVDTYIVRHVLTGEVIQGEHNKEIASRSARMRNDHEESCGRQRVYVAQKLLR